MTSDSKQYKVSYIWNLDENAFKKFIACEPTKGLTADTFNIGTLPFTLEAYPNGDNDTNQGSFMLYCTLLSFPNNYKQIVANLRLYCTESNASFTSIVIFTSQRNSAGWSANTLTINEVKELKNTTLSIGCDINIIKIIDDNNEVIAMDKNKASSTNNKSLYSLSWTINTEALINCRVGKSFESEIFDDLWCLRLLPNGKRGTDAGNVKLYLIMCAIPHTDTSESDDTQDSAHITYTLWCNETNTGYNSKMVLNYEYYNVGWPNQILLTEVINETKFASLTFNAEIEIIPAGGVYNETDASSDDDSSTYSSSSSLDNAIKGVMSDDDDMDKKEQNVKQDTNDEDEKQTEKEAKKEAKRIHIHKHHKNKKKLTVNDFKMVSLEDLMDGNNMDTLQNYDIAKKICKFYDDQFDDTDTVCMVAEKAKQPAMSYWVKSDYVRKDLDVYGKHILVYRSIKHSSAKKPLVSNEEFTEYVKRISSKYENNSVDVVADMMDDKFGSGCHYIRGSKAAQYDVYSRFSDSYECSFKLSSGAYIIAWRR